MLHASFGLQQQEVNSTLPYIRGRNEFFSRDSIQLKWKCCTFFLHVFNPFNRGTAGSDTGRRGSNKVEGKAKHPGEVCNKHVYCLMLL